MKKLLIITLLFLNQSIFADDDNVLESVEHIQKQWAIVKYRMIDSNKAQAYQKLARQAAKLSADHPGSCRTADLASHQLEQLCWRHWRIAVSNQGPAAVKKARDLLHQAENIDPNALNGSVYTSLGALYYQVPGWPIGFGDKKHARYYLEKAMTANSNKLDAGYFYGDYLMKLKDYEQAEAILETALKAPQLSNRPVADEGRRNEIKALLDQIKAKSNS